MPKYAKSRSERPIAARTRSKLKLIYRRRDTSILMQTEHGRTIKAEFAFKLTRFMDWCVSNMCLRTLKVGRGTYEGFQLYTWERCAKDLEISIDEVKHCVRTAKRKGWLTSVQPRERYTGEDNREAWRGLASIKRVTKQFFKDIGLVTDKEDPLSAAMEAARETVKAAAKKAGISVKYFLTPITLLRKFRRERAAQKDAHVEKQQAPIHREAKAIKPCNGPFSDNSPDPLIT